MKNKSIGLPRACYYYKYGILWKTFFKLIGCNVIISPETDNEIMHLAASTGLNNICLSSKIYLGHALYLLEKCDYILLPKIVDYSINNKACPMLNNMYDVINEYTFKEQILPIRIINLNKQYIFLGLLKIALYFTKNPFKILYAYFKGIHKQRKYNLTYQNEQRHKLNKKETKLLIIGQIYNIYDKYIISNIISFLKDNNIIPIFSSRIPSKLSELFSKYFSTNLYIKDIKELIGPLYYYKYQVNGIIILRPKNCGIDILYNEAIINKNKDIPILNLSTDNIKETEIKAQITNFIQKI